MAIRPEDVDQTARNAVRAAIDEQVEKAVALFDAELRKEASDNVGVMVDRIKLSLWVPEKDRDQFLFQEYGPGLEYFREQIQKKYEDAGWASVDTSFEYDTARFGLYRLEMVLYYPETPPPPAEFAA